MVKYVTKRTRYHWSLIFGLVIINNVLCVGISYDDWCCFFFSFLCFSKIGVGVKLLIVVSQICGVFNVFGVETLKWKSIYLD